MTLRAEVLDALLAAGATAEMIVAAVKADLRQEEIHAQEKRDKDAARQRKSRMSRNVTVTPRDTADAKTAPPNDIYSNPPEPSEAEASAIPFSEKVVSAWNEMAAPNGLAKARSLNPGRRRHLAARAKEHGEAAVFEAIAKLGASDWHCGRSGKSWKADLGWLLNSPENFQKMLERDGPANGAPRQAMTTEAQQAYLATLDSDTKPWMRRSEIAPPAPRKGNTGPPRPIGDLITNIAGAAR